MHCLDKMRRDGGSDGQILAIHPILQRHSVAMQMHLEARHLMGIIPIVANDGELELFGQMHAELMGTSGERDELHEAEFFATRLALQVQLEPAIPSDGHLTLVKEVRATIGKAGHALARRAACAPINVRHNPTAG